MPGSQRSPYPLPALRALALHAQALDTPLDAGPAPTPDAIYDLVAQLTCVQIDTLQVVNRSHYLALWSRLGCYDPAALDRLAYHATERRLFEYWRHAASLIPLADYRYHLPQMRWFRAQGLRQWDPDWRDNPKNLALVEDILEQVHRDGAVRASDFEREDARGGTWWDWKPAKAALEALYDQGRLMIADRVNFQRVYDLAERVLPDWVDTTEPTRDETRRYYVERAVRALGICAPMQAAEYAYLKRGEAKPHIDALVAEGVFAPVEGELADGTVGDLIVHRDHAPRLNQAAAGALPANRTTFLSPFDSLFWARDRDEQFWRFRQRLECYKPAAQREWGYFCLPILHRDRLVGRFDPKVDRKNGALYLKALYLEPGESPDDDLVAGVAAAMRDFLAFHGATDLVIERSAPVAFGEKLAAAL